MGKKIPKRYTPLISALHFAIRHLSVKHACALMAFVMTKSGKSFVQPENMRSNIREIFPDMDKVAVNALTEKMLANFGRHIGEMAHMKDFIEERNGALIEVSAPEGEPFDGTGPAIYVGGHVGSWELSCLAFKQLNRPLTVIYSQNESPIVEDLLRAQRQITGSHYVEKNQALKPCYQALGRGEAIALLVDQRVGSGLDVDFFGRKTAITRLPARLATSCNCPIIPFEVVRVKPGHLCVVTQKAIMPSGVKCKQAELELTQKIAHAIEASIRRNIESWFCSKLRWKRVDREKWRLEALQADPNAPPPEGDS